MYKLQPQGTTSSLERQEVRKSRVQTQTLPPTSGVTLGLSLPSLSLVSLAFPGILP